MARRGGAAVPPAPVSPPVAPGSAGKGAGDSRRARGSQPVREAGEAAGPERLGERAVERRLVLPVVQAPRDHDAERRDHEAERRDHEGPFSHRGEHHSLRISRAPRRNARAGSASRHGPPESWHRKDPALRASGVDNGWRGGAGGDSRRALIKRIRTEVLSFSPGLLFPASPRSPERPVHSWLRRTHAARPISPPGVPDKPRPPPHISD